MSRIDWYRRSTWTDRDQEEFNARLQRSRGAFNKAQYLRIQAIHLAEAGLNAAAIELLDPLLAEFPERIELASAHLQRAESLATLARPGPAIDEYRAALQAERNFPNVRTNAWLRFGWFAVENGLSDLYDEVLAAFKEFNDNGGLSFPIEEYRYCAVQAIIAQSQGDHSAARQFAARAIIEASKEHSGFRYHAKLGLVKSQPNWMESKLRALADG